MKTFVITGSTRGIGFALAREFLKKGCQVVINGRSDASVNTSIEKLAVACSRNLIAGFPCNVTQYDEVITLWQLSKSKFGNIDIWINNAGISNGQASFWEIPVDEIRSVIETNMLGELFGTKVAVQGFLEQGFGALYNVEGLGQMAKPITSKASQFMGQQKQGYIISISAFSKKLIIRRLLQVRCNPGWSSLT